MFSRIESIIRAITVIGVSISFRVTNTKKGMAVNKKILIVAFTTLMSEPSMAQSKFEGFFGQIATGYESNQFSSTSIAGSQLGIDETWTSDSETANGIPLIIGLSYNYSVAPKWLIGLGADYSALSQETSTYKSTRTTDSSFTDLAKLQTSNRVSVFVSTGYEIDGDKLDYLKTGYSMINIKNTYPTYLTDLVCSGCSGNFGYINGEIQNNTVGGYVVGLGYKQIIKSGLYGFAEVNYMSYSKPSFSATTISLYNFSSAPSLNSYQFLTGVGYRF